MAFHCSDTLSTAEWLQTRWERKGLNLIQQGLAVVSCIKQAETDQGPLNNVFNMYSQAIPSTPIIGIHQKNLWFHYQISQSITDNGVTPYILLSIWLKN